MASPKYNILYGRLSQEDERQGESNSIHNHDVIYKGWIKMLADKIQMAALSTVPLWESQIKIALGLHRQEGRAARQSAEADLLRIERQLKKALLEAAQQ